MIRAVANRLFLYPLISVALLAPVFAVFYWPAQGGLDITGHPVGRDFINIWAGPRLAFGAQLALLFDVDAYHAAIGRLFGHALPFHTWTYPLFVLPAFWPLSQLPYFAALAVWTLGTFAVYAAVALAPIERSQRAVALVCLALAPASLVNALNGQTGFLSAALFLGGILALDRRPILAGVLFGLLAFKPHLGLVLPFALLALGAWRTIIAAAVTVCALVVASLAMFGLEAWWHYIDVAAIRGQLSLDRFQGFYTILLASVYAGMRGVGLGYQAAMTAQFAVAVPVLAVACWAVRQTTDPCRRALVLASAAPLLTPYAYIYDLTAVTAALVWVLAGRLPWRSPWRPVYLLAWAGQPLTLLLAGLAGWPVMPLSLFALGVREAIRFPAEPGVGPNTDIREQTPRFAVP